MRARTAGFAALLTLLVSAPAAFADFPYSRPGSDTRDYENIYLNPGQVPSDLSGNESWMYSATAEPPDLLNAAVLANPAELNGVRGAHIADADAGVDTAWQVTTGRPDVLISVLDSGIEWNNEGAMRNVRFKVHLNPGELPSPRNDALATPNVAGEDCSADGPYHTPGDDLNGDGVFNLRDFACDGRVAVDSPGGVGPAGMLEPQDLLLAFSNHSDGDGNGYVDDIAGWDFLDDDNDPFDDVQYGHGTGEAQDSNAEASNGQGGAGTCPSCMVVPLRVGDSFIADSNRFAAAVTYATDNGVSVVQEALGAMNNAELSREAVDYAYRHGVTVIASAADEAAQHNNWPSSLPHVILVNSVTRYSSFADLPAPLPNAVTEQPHSYLKFNGCTNFNAKITVAIPSVSCSSDATGRGAGIAGLIYAAALNAVDRGKLTPHPPCRRGGGGACPITPNEVRQLMASGTIAGQSGADDIDFSAKPEPSCTPLLPALPVPPTCTDPFLGRGIENPTLLPDVSLIPTTKRYPARAGADQFYGYGRANVSRAVNALMPRPFGDAAVKSAIPPEVEITSPDWFDQIDPAGPAVALEGQIDDRGAPYVCTAEVAPGQYPNNRSTSASPAGDFKRVPSAQCDGATVRSGAYDGVLAQLDLADLRSRFPVTAGNFDGREPSLGVQTASGRPNTAPYAFTVRVVARSQGAPAMSGEDRRSMYLHRDASMLDGFPRKLGGDGESSPALVDLDGDNRNELIVATADGFVHAYARDPGDGAVSELPGWPVRSDRPGFVASHETAPAYASGEVADDHGGSVIASIAVGDADRDGVPEVYAADLEGGVYGWDASGRRVFDEHSNPAFSGRPLTQFANVRQGNRNRVQPGFLGSPVLADLDRNDGGRLELIAAGLDRHVYAWNDDGTPVPGFPVLVVDDSKVGAVDPQTHAVTFGPQAGPALQQGALVDTPAVGDITGDSRPEILIGSNEEYAVGEGNEGPLAAAASTSPSLSLLAPVGLLSFANGRVYAIKPTGDPDAPAAGESAFVGGWPRPVAIALAELLPLIGEGINGSPVIADLRCSSGGGGPKVGLTPAAGLAYLLNPDGSSCLGTEGGQPKNLSSDVSAGVGEIDRPVIPAVGLPAFGDLGGSQPSFVAPAAGIIRALDLALNDYQAGGQDFIAAWDPATGLMKLGWPSAVNDLSFLTGPAVGDVGGLPGEEVVAGTASMDLTALNALGLPTSLEWPKLTTDWTIATPLLGSFGTRDTDPAARRMVVNLTRSGYINVYTTGAGACAPASSPRFHHDNANSGDSRRDAVLPGRPQAFTVASDGASASFTAPGDDLLCGTAGSYQVRTSNQPIDETSFGTADPLGGAPDPAAAGGSQTLAIGAGAKRYVAIRAVDEQGNVGRPAVIDRGGSPPTGRCPNLIEGSDAGETLRGTPGGDRLLGRGGDDVIRARGGDDCANGGKGNDRIGGAKGSDRLNGAAGADRIGGGTGSDRLRGSSGADRIGGGRGADVIRGGFGADRIAAGRGADRVIVKGGGRDLVDCGPGRDTVRAGREDRLRRCEVVHRAG